MRVTLCSDLVEVAEELLRPDIFPQTAGMNTMKRWRRQEDKMRRADIFESRFGSAL